MKTESPTITMIPLKDLAASGINPRQSFVKENLEELAASIKEVGILAPLIVRVHGTNKKLKYQVVCGERRMKAAAIAGMTEVPCICRDLSDDEAMELTITENLQREDIHPLEEAHAYINLIREGHHTIADLALKFGKSQGYIRMRLKLNDLTGPFKLLWVSDRINMTTILEVAKLSQPGQEELYDFAFKNHESNHWDPPSISQLKNWIERMYSAKLAEVSFGLYDDTLLPGRPACNSCPDNTNSGYGLFPLEGEGICMNVSCLKKKKEAFLLQEVKRITDNEPGIAIGVDTWIPENDKEIIKKIKADNILVNEFSYDTGFKRINPPQMPEKPEREDYTEVDDDEEFSDDIDNYNVEMADYEAELEKYNADIAAGNVVKVLMVAGHNRGEIVHYMPTGSRDISADMTPAGLDKANELEQLREKLKRNEELAFEKTYYQAYEMFRKSNYHKSGCFITNSETRAFMFLMYDSHRHTYTDKQCVCKSTTPMIIPHDEDIVKFRYWLRDELQETYPNNNKDKVMLLFSVITFFYADEMAAIADKIDASYAKRNHTIKMRILELEGELNAKKNKKK